MKMIYKFLYKETLLINCEKEKKLFELLFKNSNDLEKKDNYFRH